MKLNFKNITCIFLGCFVLAACEKPDEKVYIEYVDFSDLSKILNKIKNEQNYFDQSQLSFVTSRLESLTAVRNRVCHSRPLEIDDFSLLFDFLCELELINQNDKNWNNLKYAKQNLNNPEFVLSFDTSSFIILNPSIFP